MMRSAFTLIESLIACVILAFSVIGVLSMVSASYAHQHASDEDATALGLARELYEEVASKPFAAQPASGWSSGVFNRSGYDDVFDYDGYTDSTNGLVTLSGTSVPATGTRIYTRTVSVTRGMSGSLVARPDDLAVVTITVAPPAGRAVTIQCLVTAADPEKQDS